MTEEEIERLIRDGARRDIPDQILGRLMGAIGGAPKRRCLPSLRWLVPIAAVAGIVIAFTLSGQHQAGDQAGDQPADSPETGRLLLEEEAMVRREFAARPVSGVVEVGGVPMRLVEVLEIESQSFVDPGTGARVEVDRPTYSYELTTANIQ